MGTALVRMKIMPNSPDVNLNQIKIEAEKIIKNAAESRMKITFEEEPIAFGLKAVIAQFAIDESKEIDPIQEKLKNIKNVSSIEIIDFRRAFG